MTIWVTKYALTKGIMRIEAEHCGGATDMIKQLGTRYPTYYHVEGRDWHRTEIAAKKHALIVRDAKIASLERQIAKLLRYEP